MNSAFVSLFISDVLFIFHPKLICTLINYIVIKWLSHFPLTEEIPWRTNSRVVHIITHTLKKQLL